MTLRAGRDYNGPAVTRDLLLFQNGAEVGRLRDGRVEVADPALAAGVQDLATRALPYLADAPDPGVERTVLGLARPGTPEHGKALMFEVRRLGLEARWAEEE